MTNESKYTIVKALLGISSKADTLQSIEEKKQLYRKYLETVMIFLSFDEEIDINSEEIDELIADNFLSIKPQKVQIFESEGYVPWLDSRKNDIAWNFYNRYETHLLLNKKWKPVEVTSIKQSSDIILDHIADPKSDKYFNKQGLVIGDIQSGKTANYTAVINKAIDAGYKIIIVLAGLTRDLRNQTQKRLDLEVLGYETKRNSKGKKIGVGEVVQLNIEGLTCSDDEKSFGDMKKFFSIHTLDDKTNPIVAIVKKNKSVLEHLRDFLSESQEYCYTNGKLNIPVLIIDDEVDQASVDTKDSETIENASAINGMIRTILSKLNRYSYVGYTATPFANVFVDPDRNDIYPKDFILCIPTNDSYCGIKEYFGVDIKNDDDYTSDHVDDLFVNISDYGDIFGNKEKISKDSLANGLNDSLKDAIMSFIIACAIKKSRGINKQNSMLIHIARYKNPSTSLKPLVLEYLSHLYLGVKCDSKKYLAMFKKYWESHFEKVSKARLADKYDDSWNKISKYILVTIESAISNVNVVNGDSEDILDYSKSDVGDYIVIGGDKLSRGLTLEGLVVSYYYRKSRAYDSLLQMGRWFGYRKGWLDVCRVFTTVEFMNDFISVGKVLQKFKSDIDDMYEQRLNPREVGQRIMYSPNLIPTARNKMKSTSKIRVSFSGELQQIITFDKKFISHNLEVTRSFIESLGVGENRNCKVVFKNVTSSQILEYLKNYKDCEKYYDYGNISVVNWINYIENLNSKGELINWTVVLNSLQSDKNGHINIGGHEINKPARRLRDSGCSENFEYYRVRVNSDPTDFREIFDVNDPMYNEVKHYDSKKNYDAFDSTKGLMSIYVVDLYETIVTDEYDEKKSKLKAIQGDKIKDGQNVCAPAIWFSKTKDYESSGTVYYVSKDYMKINFEDEEEYLDA